MISVFLSLYIFMAVVLYFRLRAVTSFSSIHCFVIALTSSIPASIRNVCLVLEIGSRWIMELGFILGGTDSDEMDRNIREKAGEKIDAGDHGDE